MAAWLAAAGPLDPVDALHRHARLVLPGVKIRYDFRTTAPSLALPNAITMAGFFAARPAPKNFVSVLLAGGLIAEVAFKPPVQDAATAAVFAFVAPATLSCQRYLPATMSTAEFHNGSPSPTASIARVGSAFTRGVIGISLVLVAWQLLASADMINAVLLPAPITLFWTAIDLLRDGTLIRHVGASIERVLVGVLCASAIGLTLGVLLGWSERLSEYLKPIVEALRPIPPIAWTPLAILWFGIGNAPSYFLVFVGAVFPVFVSTYSAVRNIERTQINAALCLGATPGMLIRDILVPGALPVIFPGLRIALGVGWMCVVAAELIAAQSGLGYMIQQSRVLLQTQNVVTGMIVIGIIGFAMNTVMTAIERRLVPWQESSKER
jgi:ABC-type nitrate/sulfonate/bicarbonate transport system permease component